MNLRRFWGSNETTPGTKLTSWSRSVHPNQSPLVIEVDILLEDRIKALYVAPVGARAAVEEISGAHHLRIGSDHSPCLRNLGGVARRWGGLFGFSPSFLIKMHGKGHFSIENHRKRG